MSLLGLGSKAVSEGSEGGKRLVNRFLGDGGHITVNGNVGQVRTDSAQAIRESIQAWAKKDADVAEFVKQLDDMDPKYLGLAHDIIDLTHLSEHVFGFSPIESNLKLPAYKNQPQTFMRVILEKLPTASKKNPAVLDLVQEVIDQSGVETAKYFIANLFAKWQVETASNVAEQIKAAKGFVKDIVEGFGGPISEFSDPYFTKRQNFYEYLLRLCSSDTKPENISLLKQACKISDKYKPAADFNLDEMRLGDTETIRRNLKNFPTLMENAQNKGLEIIDASGFLTRNVDLK